MTFRIRRWACRKVFLLQRRAATLVRHLAGFWLQDRGRSTGQRRERNRMNDWMDGTERTSRAASKTCFVLLVHVPAMLPKLLCNAINNINISGFEMQNIIITWVAWIYTGFIFMHKLRFAYTVYRREMRSSASERARTHPYLCKVNRGQAICLGFAAPDTSDALQTYFPGWHNGERNSTSNKI